MKVKLLVKRMDYSKSFYYLAIGGLGAGALAALYSIIHFIIKYGFPEFYIFSKSDTVGSMILLFFLPFTLITSYCFFLIYFFEKKFNFNLFPFKNKNYKNNLKKF
ncbi:MAG: hypothetical protein LBB10_01915 [Bifidobacteriaceae bacterium]|jgi:hypothetical protein|nr:hypothetical protein [Bifidobacteriaceae bacterium]